MARLCGYLTCSSSSSAQLAMACEGRGFETGLAPRGWDPHWSARRGSVPLPTNRKIHAQSTRKHCAHANGSVIQFTWLQTTWSGAGNQRIGCARSQFAEIATADFLRSKITRSMTVRMFGALVAFHASVHAHIIQHIPIPCVLASCFPSRVQMRPS